MSQANNCPSCSFSIHLWSDSPILTKEKLLSQVVCVFCWIPLSSSSSLLNMSPMVSSCGHMFHRGCLEHREKMYKDTPTRCPICGYTVSKIRTMHFLNKLEDKEMMDRRGSLDVERMELLLKIEELKERIANL